jgi:hypothetical protein
MEKRRDGMREIVEAWKGGGVEGCNRGIVEKGNEGTVVPLEWSSDHAPVRSICIYRRDAA